MGKGKPFQKKQRRMVSPKDGGQPACDKCYKVDPADNIGVHGRCLNCRETYGDLSVEDREASIQRFKDYLNGRQSSVVE